MSILKVQRPLKSTRSNWVTELLEPSSSTLHIVAFTDLGSILMQTSNKYGASLIELFSCNMYFFMLFESYIFSLCLLALF